MGVSSADWRGDSEVQVEPEVVDLEIVACPAQTSVRAPTVLSKEDESQTPMSGSSADTTLAQDDAV